MNRAGKKFREESNSFYNEREVRSIDYDKDAPSKENVELSLEVEIADSLKQILTSPKNCTSRLLDVTIIRPNDAAPQVETNTVAFDKHEIKDLISIIEKQKQEKRKRIEEQRKKLGATYRTCSPQTLQVQSEMTRPRSPKTVRINHQPEYINDARSRGMCTSSAPPGMTLNKDQNYYDVQGGDSKNRTDYARKLKKYKDIEGRLLEIASKSKYSPNSKLIDFEGDRGHLYSVSTPNQVGEYRQHVFAAQRTFDDIRNKFKCTADRSGKPDEPCVCQHCGLMGVILDSQKGPVLPATTRSATPWKNSKVELKPNDKKNPNWRENFLPVRTKTNSNDCILKQINIRLKSLEERVNIQEETAVTRDYFKLVMNKLLLSCRSADAYKKDSCVQTNKRSNDTDSHAMYTRNKPTNYSFKSRDDSSSRYNKRGNNYTVHQALLDTENTTEACDSLLNSEFLLGFKFDKIDEADEPAKVDSKELKDSLWRWGEEVIKPGFDLKNKIMSLLEEKLNNLKATHSHNKDSNVEEPKASVQVEVDNERKATSEPPNTINILPETKFFNQRGIMPLKTCHDVPNEYKMDVRRAMDDSTFRRNIEERKKASNFRKHLGSRQDMLYDTGDTSTTFLKNRKHVRYKASKSDTEIRHVKKKELVQIEAKSYVARPLKDYPPSDSTYIKKKEKKSRGHKKKDFGTPFILDKKDTASDNQPIHVNYVNPKASSWFDDSATDDSRVTKSKKGVEKKHRSKSSLSEKLRYLRQLAKHKNVKEEVVWNNIVKQVKKYSNKEQNETVKIQVPTDVLYRIKNPEKRVTEIELTLADLQELVSKSNKKNDDGSSTGSANTIDHRKKLKELHKHLGAMLNKNRPTKFGI